MPTRLTSPVTESFNLTWAFGLFETGPDFETGWKEFYFKKLLL